MFSGKCFRNFQNFLFLFLASQCYHFIPGCAWRWCSNFYLFPKWYFISGRNFDNNIGFEIFCFFGNNNKQPKERNDNWNFNWNHFGSHWKTSKKKQFNFKYHHYLGATNHNTSKTRTDNIGFLLLLLIR